MNRSSIDTLTPPRTRQAGIYRIRNTTNDKVYLGCAVNFRRRFLMHLRDLLKNVHHSIKLQRAWNKYGEDSFIIEILEVVNNPTDLLSREQFYLDRDQPFRQGYNICREARNRLGVKSSPETCLKISKALKGRKQTPEHRERNRLCHLGIMHSQETKDKIASTSLGRTHTDEAKEKIGAAQRSKVVSPETREKIGSANRGNQVWLGKRHTEESKKKMRESHLKRVWTPEEKARLVETIRRVHTGKVLSEETRRKIGAANKGRPVSDETRAKLRAAWARRKKRKQAEA